MFQPTICQALTSHFRRFVGETRARAWDRHVIGEELFRHSLLESDACLTRPELASVQLRAGSRHNLQNTPPRPHIDTFALGPGQGTRPLTRSLSYAARIYTVLWTTASAWLGDCKSTNLIEWFHMRQTDTSAGAPLPAFQRQRPSSSRTLFKTQEKATKMRLKTYRVGPARSLL